MKLKVIRKTWEEIKSEGNDREDMADYASDYLDGIFDFVDTQDKQIADLEAQSLKLRGLVEKAMWQHGDGYEFCFYCGTLRPFHEDDCPTQPAPPIGE